jgi:hypothetical protein
MSIPNLLLSADAVQAPRKGAVNLMEPQSNPSYYKNILKELEEVHSRSVLTKLGLWIKGKVRMS